MLRDGNRPQSTLKRKLRRAVAKLQRALEVRGLSGTLRLAGVSIWLRVVRLTSHRTPPVIDEFDQKFGVETSRRVMLSDLDINSPHYGYATEYSAVPPMLFNQAMAALDIYHSRFRFIDLGSGKGRALLLAAAFPFREVIGVEFSTDLHAAALENIQKYSGAKNCTQIRSVCLDAVAFVFPEDPLVIFLFHPFVGKPMLRVLVNIEQTLRACPRELFVIYFNPIMAREFAACSGIREIVSAPEYRIYRGLC